ncbi:non-heme iron oxygenase ferredoxin subunit [Janibacter sp. GS2]|uniref:non-heme iron oxygenase ferredoxin subunit n=1 Tax=Janibacter sp. GS2 TaxID=3442646 RepID=UPI003EC0D70B
MSATTDADYVRVCGLDELPATGAAKAEIEGRVVSIIRAEDGSVHCIDDECTHGRVSLSEGEVEGCEIECWLHGSRFNLVTGKPTGLPATVPVVVHSVRVTDGEVLVALADEAPRTV